MRNKRRRSDNVNISAPTGATKIGNLSKSESTASKTDSGNKVRSGAIAQNMLPEDYRPSEDEDLDG